MQRRDTDWPASVRDLAPSIPPSPSGSPDDLLDDLIRARDCGSHRRIAAAERAIVVEYLAARRRGRGADLEDLVQGARLGLLKAGSLKDRQRTLLQLRFFEDRSQQEIACEVGVSQMQVSRLLTQIFATLSAAIGETRPA